MERCFCLFVILSVTSMTKAAEPPDVQIIFVKDITSVSATVNWVAPVGNFDNYSVSTRGPTGAIVETRIVSREKNNLVLKDLIPGASYVVYVRSRFGWMESYPKSKSFQTLALDPVDPASISFSMITSNSAKISWGAAYGVYDGYSITISSADKGAQANPAIVPKGTVTTSLIKLKPGSFYTVAVRVRLKSAESSASAQGFQTWPKVTPAPMITAVSALVLALIAHVVIIVVVTIHRRNAGNKGASDDDGYETPKRSVVMSNLAYQADQERSQAMDRTNDTSDIGEFRTWLLSQQVTEETYATLEKEGLHDPAIFANMKPDQVLRLSVKPLGQEFLIQKIAEGFKKGQNPFRARKRGNSPDSLYDDVDNNTYTVPEFSD